MDEDVENTTKAQERIEELEAMLADSDQTLRETRASAKRLRHHIDKLDGQLKDSENAVDGLKKELGAADADARYLDEKLDQMADEVNNWRTMCPDLKDQRTPAVDDAINAVRDLLTDHPIKEKLGYRSGQRKSQEAYMEALSDDRNWGVTYITETRWEEQ